MTLGRASGDFELMNALTNACERLAALTLLEERVLQNLDEEREKLGAALAASDGGALRTAIQAYQKRRDRAVPQIVELLQRPF
jgi:hypothetical protein